MALPHLLAQRERGLLPRERLTHELTFNTTWARSLRASDVLSGHGGCINRLAWSSDGAKLASGSDDKQVGAPRGVGGPAEALRFV
jgi:hypothetical protein